jgi:hypothetical protein
MRLTVIFLLLCSPNLVAQSGFLSIQGNVTDRTSGDPIPFASVYLRGQAIGTITNSDGRFLFHVPTSAGADTLVISCIGYEPFSSVVTLMNGKKNEIALQLGVTPLKDVSIQSAHMDLSAGSVIKKAVAAIPANYPMTPFVIEGFFRDLQIENEKPVELLEAAVRLRYKDYNPGLEQAEVIEVRRAYNHRHPVNGTYDRQNSIVDLMEDNYIKQRFGPIKGKGWKFVIDSVTVYGGRAVYLVHGSRSRNESTLMHIDADNFVILRLELTRQLVDGKPYRRYLNLPDPYGLQETSFRVIFEYQEIDGKMYLRYQREEDTYDLFIKATNEIILRQAFVKELFVNKVASDPGDMLAQPMNIQQSVEQQAQAFNPEFWKYYNAPVETANESMIVRQLEKTELKTSN